MLGVKHRAKATLFTSLLLLLGGLILWVLGGQRMDDAIMVLVRIFAVVLVLLSLLLERSLWLEAAGLALVLWLGTLRDPNLDRDD